ncbi:MAG: hypothetical protein JJV98_10840 [Desulfosarcina sp.]|nr:hypothetical protein [Desulfobacterales bacterium]
MISLDHEKIGAEAQLRIYGDILELPLEIPHTGKAMKMALERLDQCDVVLVDTPAIGAGKTTRPSVFEELLRATAQLKVWLVVGADTREENMHLTAAVSDDLAPSAIVVTKVDLGRSFDGLIKFLSRMSLPVVGLSNGPRVPGDLTAASYDLFARLLLKGGHRPEEVLLPEASDKAPAHNGQYLANRNSDIFHRSECKWIRLINKENIVMFGSFAEALNNRFKPCRYCNPQHMSITGMLNQEMAVR